MAFYPAARENSALEDRDESRFRIEASAAAQYIVGLRQAEPLRMHQQNNSETKEHFPIKNFERSNVSFSESTLKKPLSD